MSVQAYIDYDFIGPRRHAPENTVWEKPRSEIRDYVTDILKINIM